MRYFHTNSHVRFTKEQMAPGTPWTSARNGSSHQGQQRRSHGFHPKRFVS